MLALPIVAASDSCSTLEPQAERGGDSTQPDLQTAEPTRSGGKFCLVTLGCPKNLVDSERMAGLLGLNGYEMVAEPEGSDFVVINTCAFIGDSRAESHAVIREMLDLKKNGRTRGVIV